ncbi:uncharacterized protein PRCAT00003001001 [Priceomyces carsonii]|uniref:uncharacterized protein n=1 Tax=Priceomyces carsonii TaxID=28549 RepID=UPI002EDBAC65|nr:unnamed protein product [Priceomyces carsonii]
MPTRNSVNKPKDKIISNRHAASIGKKRAARSSKARVTASSTSRYDTNTVPRPTESKALALYAGKSGDSKLITNNTLSNKRAKKIARNQKYVDKRNEKLNIDITSKEEAMMEDDTEESLPESSTLKKVKDALWTVIEDNEKNGLEIKTDGEGTTLGIQAF